MQKTQKPVIGGILSIVGGSLGVLSAIGILIAVVFVPGNIGVLLLSIAAWFFIFGILSIIGGVFAVQRKLWGLAITGSIAAIFSLIPLGIASIVLTSMSKDEFE